MGIQIKNIKGNRKLLAPQIIPKTISQTRKDIQSWKMAERMANSVENPKFQFIQELFTTISKDPLLKSQINNRNLKTLSKKIILKKENGKVDEEQSKNINKSLFTRKINKAILNAKYKMHSLIEFDYKDDEFLVTRINRSHIDPKNGLFYPDLNKDQKIKFRETPEYGTWLIEIDHSEELGLLNDAVPYALFKKFAMSCYSELCEIYGIPPRVLKTDTRNPQSMNRGKRMMEDMGAAAWFIIDESETFEFAKGVSTNGDVYSNLISLCNNEMSLLISGAIIGQDTKHGSKGKELSSQEVLASLVEDDQQEVTQIWNTNIIPALTNIGVLTGDLTFEFEQTEDVEQLWTWTKEVLPHKNVDNDWIKEKFGIEVSDKVNANPAPNLSLSANPTAFFD